MNWEEAKIRIEGRQETSQSEAVNILRSLLTDSVEHSQNDDEAMFEAGTLVLSLVSLWDYSENVTTWKNDELELLDYLAVVVTKYDHPKSFGDFLRRLIDRTDVMLKKRGEDYKIDLNCFSSVQEALETLNSVEEDVLAWEREQDYEQREIKRAKRKNAKRPLTLEEKASRKRKLNFLQAVGLVLVGLGIFAATKHDWTFFVLLFVLLLEAGLVYASEKEVGPNQQLKQFRVIVAGFAVTSLLVAGVTLMYLGKCHEYQMLGKVEPIESKETFDSSYRDGQNTADFVSGVVSKENRTYRGHHSDDETLCAIYNQSHNGAASLAPVDLFVDLADGSTVTARGSELYRNRYDRHVRVGWPWREGLTRKKQWQCLEIGKPVSIRGTLMENISLDGKRSTMGIQADEIFPGNSKAHANYQRSRMPKPIWSIIMAKVSLATLSVFVLVFLFYLIRLIKLSQSSKPDRKGT